MSYAQLQQEKSKAEEALQDAINEVLVDLKRRTGMSAWDLTVKLESMPLPDGSAMYEGCTKATLSISV